MMRHRKRVWVMLLVCGLVLAPLVAAAQVEDGTVTDPTVERSPAKMFDLAMCAVSIVAIETGVGAARSHACPTTPGPRAARRSAPGSAGAPGPPAARPAPGRRPAHGAWPGAGAGSRGNEGSGR